MEQHNQEELSSTLAKPHHVDGDTWPLQGSGQQELEALESVSVDDNQDLKLVENVSQREVSVNNEQIPCSKAEELENHIEPYPLPHLHCNQSELQMVTQKPLTVPEPRNQKMGQEQYDFPHSKCNENEEETVVQKETESHPCVTNMNKEKGQPTVVPYLQEISNEPNQGSGVKEQVKQMQNQQTKKQKTSVVGDNHERINYLVQVSRTLVNMGQSLDETSSLNFDKPLASQTGSLATAVGRKSLVRLSPSLKRVLCKGCGTTLIYGVNARVRQRSNRQRHLVITCLVCNTIRRLVCDVRHKLWCEQEEAIV